MAKKKKKKEKVKKTVKQLRKARKKAPSLKKKIKIQKKIVKKRKQQIKKAEKKGKPKKAEKRKKQKKKAHKKLGKMKFKRLVGKPFAEEEARRQAEEDIGKWFDEEFRFKQEEFDRAGADYETDKAGLEEEYQQALADGNWEKAQYIKQLNEDYSLARDRELEEGKYDLEEMGRQQERLMGGLRTSYAERGLLRSGGRETRQTFEEEEYGRRKGAYERESERRLADFAQTQKRGEEAGIQRYGKWGEALGGTAGRELSFGHRASKKALERPYRESKVGWEKYAQHDYPEQRRLGIEKEISRKRDIYGTEMDRRFATGYGKWYKKFGSKYKY